VVRQYGDTMLEWINKPKSKLGPNMFFDLANWAGDLRKRAKEVKKAQVELTETINEEMAEKEEENNE
jgi:hypothetical protein